MRPETSPLFLVTPLDNNTPSHHTNKLLNEIEQACTKEATNDNDEGRQRAYNAAADRLGRHGRSSGHNSQPAILQKLVPPLSGLRGQTSRV